MVREKMLFLVLIAFVLAPVSASFAQHSDPMRRIGVFMTDGPAPGGSLSPIANRTT